MMIRVICLLMICLMPVGASANPIIGDKHTASCEGLRCSLFTSGVINLSQTRSPQRSKNITFKMNNDVQGVLKLYHSKVNNKDMIKGEFLMNNALNQKSYLRYRVVLKDQKGPIGQSKGDIYLGQGKNQKMKFGSITFPAQDLKNISNYEIQISSSNKKFN